MDINNLEEIFTNCELAGDKIIVKSDLIEILKTIKKDYSFNILKDITAVDNRENGIELIYRLYSTDNDEDVLLSVTTNNEAESVTKLFDSATADEKEIYDLFGVKFIGNNELERLYMPDSWKGHPLLKNYDNNDERLNWNDRN